ncbi:glycosyl hydrolase [Saccharicrinis sp. FJH62]|uniref:glycosyl hydrolase n=1 Tax=Saccharicrinis sp. FJH62 TaxID=3344657 RepID=UPI0035D3E92E
MKKTVPYPVIPLVHIILIMHELRKYGVRVTGVFCFILLLISIPDADAQKRGIAYGHHSPKDMETLAPAVSWWYNWSETPESTVADVYGDYGFDFVPMTWNGSFNESKLRTFLDKHPETKYLLAFNEPNFLDQANMKPSQVAAIWPRLEAIAADYNLEIVGPAVNFCNSCVSENGTTYTDPVQYLDDFFAACPDCQVDYIAVHCYMNHASALEWYISLFEKYNKPIWLTEFAGWEYNDAINSPEDQISFMMEAVEFLENSPDVFRYAWFIGRTSGGIQSFPYIDLLGANGQLTDLGQAYKAMPVHDTARVVQVPARIEAEDYNRALGMKIERTSDQDGVMDVTDVQINDYLEYRIDVPADGTYNFDIRVSSTRRTALKVYVDGSAVLTHQIPDNDGWDNWSTVTKTIDLSKGIHILKLVALGSGFNLNWFEIRNQTAQKLDEKPGAAVILNASGNDVLIISGTSASANRVQIYNIDGIPVLKKENATQIDLGTLVPGIYVVEVNADNHRILKKIVKQ